MKTLAKRFDSIQQLLNDRPMAVLSTSGGIRDFLLGLGFILGLDQIRQTQLYMNYDQLVPGTSGVFVGILFVIIGLMVCITAFLEKHGPVIIGLRFQALAWLFSTLMYALYGHFLLAAIFGVFFSFPAGYLAFRYTFLAGGLTDCARPARL